MGKHLIANDGDISKIPKYEYSFGDLVADFCENPGGVMKVGGSDRVEEYPVIEPRGRFHLPKVVPESKKIALIGHSAGGWISRVYLSNHNYGGKAYQGQNYVH